jgi:hypothetical protein
MVLVGSGSLSGQEWKEFRTARQIGDLETLEVEILYGAGRLSVAPAEERLLYDVRMRYDGDRFAPVRSWTTDERAGKLTVSLRSEGSEEEAVTVLLDDIDIELDLEDLRRLDDEAGRLTIRLGPSVPTDLRVAVGAAEGTLALGGLSLTRLKVETGASQTHLTFDRANKVRLEDLQLKVGAAEFRAENLGNANFERFRFDGGVGDVTLDFGGEWKESSTARVKMGLGALRLRFPRDLAVRIVRRSLLSAFDAEGFTRVGDAYQTANWASAEVRLELELDAIFAAITVERLSE